MCKKAEVEWLRDKDFMLGVLQSTHLGLDLFKNK